MRGFVGGRPGGWRIYADEDKSNKDAIYLTCVPLKKWFGVVMEKL